MENRKSLSLPPGLATTFTLVHLKQINPQKLPAAARASKKQNGSAGTLTPQFFSFKANVGCHKIRVQLFSSQDATLPDLRLCPDDATYEPNKLTRNNARLQFNLLATDDYLVHLPDKSARRAVYLQAIRRRFRFNSPGSSGQ